MANKFNRKAMVMMKYLGNGFLIGVPARDLTQAEVEALGIDPAELLASGLYAEKAGRKKTAVDGQKDGGDESDACLRKLDTSCVAPTEIDDLENTDKEILR